MAAAVVAHLVSQSAAPSPCAASPVAIVISSVEVLTAVRFIRCWCNEEVTKNLPATRFGRRHFPHVAQFYLAVDTDVTGGR
jgi:hypothetical protein